jgi:antitoxin VapB
MTVPLNIRSEEVNILAQQLASLKKVSKTEAVRQALQEAVTRENDNVPFMDRIKEIQDRVAARGRSGLEADKAFYDSLNDE